MRGRAAVGDVNAVAERLKEAGLKVTAQRLAVVRCLVGDVTHPTAQDLFERLKPDFPTMSFATVYNTLAALTSVGAVSPVELGGPLRFDPNVMPHDHFVCSDCGSVRDVSTRAQHRVQELVTTEDELVEVHRVERIYRGLCASCLKQREEKHPVVSKKRE